MVSGFAPKTMASSSVSVYRLHQAHAGQGFSALGAQPEQQRFQGTSDLGKPARVNERHLHANRHTCYLRSSSFFKPEAQEFLRIYLGLSAVAVGTSRCRLGDIVEEITTLFT